MKTKIDSTIRSKILEVRGLKVMLDSDLAELYKVQTKELNQAVKRNLRRFPKEFMFTLSTQEWNSLRSQIVTLENGRGKHKKFKPKVFTEYGVIMAASVLRSKNATRMNIAIIRSFIALRQYAIEHKELHKLILEMEKKYDFKFNSIEQVINYLLEEKKTEQLQKSRRRIGFKASKTK
ncbi:MAG: ORF6N domain-containing protein [Bacteroidetes bacterium]|nr:ORF6N domain-containing protein [Bacteroidota bacterium]MBK9526373.1 ORF6N domain-containing protein [Bacteroidota bacterium]MBK9544048.1 ORF6N domain-containing protein [Bacteroidota bacterium]MBP6401006.1 ORF6N domain-containing protein [Bacteroidia bacterium]MBP6650077.1 ORF6N domain-containing protein [Bacteroidia bacterium]